MLAIIATIAAVAGGQLAVTMRPSHPRIGQRTVLSLTGTVGDKGHLYVFRNRAGRRCSASARGERRIGVSMASWAIDAPFDRRVGFVARSSTFVCVYLYAITCDAAGSNCAPATGLPPDAGFAQVRVSVRR